MDFCLTSSFGSRLLAYRLLFERRGVFEHFYSASCDDDPYHCWETNHNSVRGTDFCGVNNRFDVVLVEAVGLVVVSAGITIGVHRYVDQTLTVHLSTHQLLK